MYNGGADPTVMPDLCLRTYAIFDKYQINYSLKVEPDLKHNLSQGGLEHLSKFLTEAMNTE